MKQKIIRTVFFLLSLSLLFAGCAQTEKNEAPSVAPTKVAPSPTSTPTPTLAPTPAPIVVDIPSEADVAAMAIDRIEDTPFFNEVTNIDDVVLVEFWSPGNAYSAGVAETLRKISSDMGVKIVRVNVDENPELANGFGLVMLPSVYVFKSGVHANSVLGAAPYEDYKAIVEQYQN